MSDQGATIRSVIAERTIPLFMVEEAEIRLVLAKMKSASDWREFAILGGFLAMAIAFGPAANGGSRFAFAAWVTLSIGIIFACRWVAFREESEARSRIARFKRAYVEARAVVDLPEEASE